MGDAVVAGKNGNEGDVGHGTTHGVPLSFLAGSPGFSPRHAKKEAMFLTFSTITNLHHVTVYKSSDTTLGLTTIIFSTTEKNKLAISLLDSHSRQSLLVI